MNAQYSRGSELTKKIFKGRSQAKFLSSDPVYIAIRIAAVTILC